MIFISALDDFALSVSARYAAGKCLFHYLEWLFSLLSFLYFLFLYLRAYLCQLPFIMGFEKVLFIL